MALQTALNFKGIDLPAAYVRVDRIFGGKREGWNSVVGVYASAEAAADQQPLETYNQATEYVAEASPIALVYAALKLKYPAAVDC